MSAVPHSGPGFLAAALARVDEYFFERVAEPSPAPLLETHARVVVAGLGRRVGATTVARALGVELAARAGGAAVVTASPLPARGAPSSRAARRVAVAFGERPLAMSGRLCLVETAADIAPTAAAARYLAPFVADWPYGTPAATAAALDAPIVLVATPSIEPALAAAVAEAIPGATVVLNRDRALEEWHGSAHAVVPEARLHARIALAGRPVSGRFGAAIAALAERVA